MSTANRTKLAVFALLTVGAASAGTAAPAVLALAAVTALIPVADALDRKPAARPDRRPAPEREPV
ncbi:hypothetical protein RMN56_01280 [Micromonospora halotolerans]|uniref:Secreted protein n=1 Tax=Micromonospora halotolerans TaxID=709879 RepID=A0ABY9ZZM4_9ACTN|nr:hypothetical protein [Micromonospora halotolerans]WNM40020.1 hypothetical protein RMN56_01280 [Micromonospora halotolerans]